MVQIVRYGLPAAIAVAGVLFIVLGDGAIAIAFGIVLIGVAALVLLANLFVRLSVASEGDRDRERRARERFTRVGRWPSG